MYYKILVIFNIINFSLQFLKNDVLHVFNLENNFWNLLSCKEKLLNCNLILNILKKHKVVYSEDKNKTLLKKRKRKILYVYQKSKL